MSNAAARAEQRASKIAGGAGESRARWHRARRPTVRVQPDAPQRAGGRPKRECAHERTEKKERKKEGDAKSRRPRRKDGQQKQCKTNVNGRRESGTTKRQETLPLDLRTLTENEVVDVDQIVGTRSIPYSRSVANPAKRDRGRPRETVVAWCRVAAKIKKKQNKQKRRSRIIETSHRRPAVWCRRRS